MAGEIDYLRIVCESAQHFERASELCVIEVDKRIVKHDKRTLVLI